MYIVGNKQQEIARTRASLELGGLTKEEIDAEIDKWLCVDNSKKSLFAWIGINPPIGKYTIEKLFKECKLPYEHYIFCVEQHTANGIRPHIHALAEVNKDTRPSREIPKLAKIFDVSLNVIEYKISKHPVVNDARRAYILGNKSKEKQENVLKDKLTRTALNIPDYYEH